jgi:riboflavin biosynthesis pyrimidine reductase
VKTDELREKRVREGLAPDPVAIVVSARLELPPDVPIFQEPTQRVVIVTGSDAELQGVEAQVEYLRVGDDLQLALARLRADGGIRSVLCEGGPTLNSFLFAAGLVDELWLSLSSKLVGGPAALTIVAGRELVDPAELEPVSVAVGGRDLFTRWRVLRPR